MQSKPKIISLFERGNGTGGSDAPHLRLVGPAIWSVVALAIYEIFHLIYAPQATLLSAAAARNQISDSNSATLSASYTQGVLTTIDRFSWAVLLLALVLIWRKQARSLFAALFVVAGVGMTAATLLPSRALAFAETADKTEAYTILPNETAFWIPDTGANKTSQAQVDSEAYLQENKISLKRFVVPHQKLSGSGGNFGWDLYVPAGRLIIVDRTPYSREWVAAHDRGTSAHNESFPCQSKEGLNITAGVSIGTSVSETNAAKYLYRFGVLPTPGDRTDPRVIFASVFYGRKLSDVMDDVGRKKVQTLVCNEIGSRSFDQVNAEIIPMMTAIARDATTYFAAVGITLDFIGWADTLTFDRDVQDAVNRKYVASVDQQIAATLAPYAETIQALASANATRAFGEKSDGRFPTTTVNLPNDVNGLLSALLAARQIAPQAVDGSTPTAPPPAVLPKR